MTVHIMLDLETWGTAPGCDIRSIGACVFDPQAGTIGRGLPHGRQPGKLFENIIAKMGVTSHSFYMACDNPVIKNPLFDSDCSTIIRKYPLNRDPRTAQWWSEQSDEAQAAFADPVDLREASLRFCEWVMQITGRSHDNPAQPDDLCIWSHGPQFDISILAAAYEAVGLPVPWHYRAPRDTRTLFDAAGIEDHSAWLKQFPGPLGLPHHALDDAICQARAVCAAQRIIQRWRNCSFSDDALPSYLNNITNAIEDEGDRAYFGSTNDAGHLKQIASDMDAGRFEREYEG